MKTWLKRILNNLNNVTLLFKDIYYIKHQQRGYIIHKQILYPYTSNPQVLYQNWKAHFLNRYLNSKSFVQRNNSVVLTCMKTPVLWNNDILL